MKKSSQRYPWAFSSSAQSPTFHQMLIVVFAAAGIIAGAILLRQNLDVTRRAAESISSTTIPPESCGNWSGLITYPPPRNIDFQRISVYGCTPNTLGCFQTLPTGGGSFLDRYMSIYYGFLPANSTYSIDIPICGAIADQLGIMPLLYRSTVAGKGGGTVSMSLTSPNGEVYPGLAPPPSPYQGCDQRKPSDEPCKAQQARCVFPSRYTLEEGVWRLTIRTGSKAVSDAKLILNIFNKYGIFVDQGRGYQGNDPLMYECPSQDWPLHN